MRREQRLPGSSFRLLSCPGLALGVPFPPADHSKRQSPSNRCSYKYGQCVEKQHPAIGDIRDVPTNLKTRLSGRTRAATPDRGVSPTGGWLSVHALLLGDEGRDPGATAHAELVQDIADVGLDGVLAEVELCGDLTVGLSRCDEGKNSPLML